MIKLIWIDTNNNSDNLKSWINIDSLWLFTHLFKSWDNFIISKFVSNFVMSHHNNTSSFSFELFVEKQVEILKTDILLMYDESVIDISNSSNEEILALLNTWDIIVYYSYILGYNELYNIDLKLSWWTKIVSQYMKFKEDLIKKGNIDFLPVDLSWKSNTYSIIRKEAKQITFSKLIEENISKEKISTKLTTALDNQIYTPTRGSIRFFLYHFFWFATFSEEMKNTVNLWTIFEPSKYEEIYNNNPSITKTEWGQYNIIESILQGKNTLGILSTWSGKSITFLLTWMLKPWMTFIIAPLKSLIDDQYHNLEVKFWLTGITGRIHSWLNKEDKKENEVEMLSWNFKFLYCAPERLQIEKFIKDIQSYSMDAGKINQIIVDEAHCLSERGHDFRFSYLNIKLFPSYIQKNNLKNIPIVWLTATASDVVRQDIIKYLEIEYIVQESTLNRSNLSFEIQTVKSSEEKPEIIRDVITEKIPQVLWHVANISWKTVWPLMLKSEGWKYNNSWLVFTIYGPIGRKSNNDAVAQTAEYIWKYLRDSFATKDVWLYMGESPKLSNIEVCPACFSSNIKKARQQKWMYISYRDNTSWLYISERDRKKLSKRRRNMCSKEEQSSSFFCCWNNSCQKIFNTPLSQDLDVLDDDQKSTEWNSIKMKTQNMYKENQLPLLVATKWFWMWIDKSNIRYILHTTLSWSLEAYYQEVWRAGRDQEHSHCILCITPPTDSCLKEMNNFKDINKKLPSCMTDPENLQYSKCPKWLNSMCDFARQMIMISRPTIVDLTPDAKRSKLEFLHTFLQDDDFLIEPNKAVIPKYNINLKWLLLENIGSGFTHLLVEFRQFYFFYEKYIKPERHNDQILITIKNDKQSSWYEKMIYRLLCIGLVKNYFKKYNGLYEVTFILNINQKINIEETVNNYLKDKLNISEHRKDHKTDLAYQDIIINQFNSNSNGILNMPLYKQVRKLLYYIYDIVETNRRESLRNLYTTIDEGVNNNCIRNSILKRLSLLKNKDTEDKQIWKCGFCSWCNPDTTTFNVKSWLLYKDKEIERINKILRRQFKWEVLNKAESNDLKKYDIQIKIEHTIQRFFNEFETSWDNFMKLVNLVDKDNYNITGFIQKKIEAWTYSPRYYLLSAYYEKQYFKERITEARDLFNTDDQKESLYTLWKIFSESEKLGEIKKEFLLWAKKLNSSMYLYLWLMHNKENINPGYIGKLGWLLEAYKHFSNNNN